MEKKKRPFLQKLTEKKIAALLLFGLFFISLILYPIAKGKVFEKREPWERQLIKAVKNNYAPLWMHDQIERDLTPFKEGITKEMIDTCIDTEYEGDPGLILFKIENRTVSTPKMQTEMFIHDPRTEVVTKALKKMCKLLPVSDMEIIIGMHDSCTGMAQNPDFKGPVFSFAKNRNTDRGIILIPDFEAFKGHKSFVSKVKRAALEYPWEKKIDKAIWRGSATGGEFTMDNYKSYPRSVLVQLSHKYPEYLDARMTLFIQMDEGVKKHMIEEGYKGNFLSVVRQLQYKYQVLADGNSSAYSHSYWTYLSNSVVIRHQSDEIQWYDNEIKPWEHYIPVKRDFSDLIEKIKWAKEHDDKAHQIAINATTFVENNLTLPDIYLYFYLLLKEYAKLQTFE